jgi:integrase
MKNRKQEKEVPVRNHPGISKKFEFDEEVQKWVDTGKFRTLRRTVINGTPKKEQAVFDNLEGAKLFRAGKLNRELMGNNTHKLQSNSPTNVLTFGGLLEKWKPFHFLQLERSTQQTYEKRLPNLDYLKACPVEQITTSVVDDLVTDWVTNYPKSGQRQTFEKELHLLKVVLNFYRKRINPSYAIPVLDEHYRAADMAKKADAGVQSLSQEELAAFLDDLRNSKSPQFASIALAQFCLGLRIGEVCGLYWDAIDIKNRVVRIERTIVWDQITWEPRVKESPKNGKVRVLVIPKILVLELERLKAVRDPKVPFVFHCHGRPMNRQTVGKAYNRALGRLGYKHVKGTHMVRKTSATLANEFTGDFYAVSKLMDHSSPNVTLKYVAQTTAQKRKVADALDAVLKQGSESRPGTAGDTNSRGETRDASCPVPERPRPRNSVSLCLVKSNG